MQVIIKSELHEPIESLVVEATQGVYESTVRYLAKVQTEGKQHTIEVPGGHVIIPAAIFSQAVIIVKR